jgi:hypothetical protein
MGEHGGERDGFSAPDVPGALDNRRSPFAANGSRQASDTPAEMRGVPGSGNAGSLILWQRDAFALGLC